MEKKSMGAFIAVLRKANGLTQKQLAEKLYVSDKAVSRWERDESMPELSLIPVMADLFGVTADELLRGERAPQGGQPEGSAVQVRYIVENTLTKYKVRSCISGAIALVGLAAAMALNIGFLRAYAGFFTGCGFLIVSCLCQVVFLIQGRAAVDTDVADLSVAAQTRKAMLYGAELVFGGIAVLLCAMLPLILFPPSALLGLSVKSWAIYGGLMALAGAVAVLAVCTVVNIRRGIWTKPDWNAPKTRLRLRWLKRAGLLLLAAVLAHSVTAALLSGNYHLLLGGRKFDSWDDLRRYMETPMDEQGRAMTFVTIEGRGEDTRYVYLDGEGETLALRKEDVSTVLYATVEDEAAGENQLVRFRWLNRSVADIRLSGGGLPVQVFSRTQQQAARLLLALLHLFWCAVYLGVVVRMLKKYRAEKALPDSD